MLMQFKRLVALFLTLGLVLAACNSGASSSESTPTSNQADTVFTSAAQTAEAMAQATAAAPTATLLEPTRPLLTPSASPTLTLTPTALFTPSLTPTNTKAGWNMAFFVTDVTIPDGTNLAPGQAFVKTWRVKNVGPTVWTTAYTLVYHYGEQMSGPASTNLLANVQPGEEVDLSVNLVAPVKPGKYRGYWRLQDANGNPFGVGAAYNEDMWVEIVVPGATDTPAPTETLTATASPAATATPTATETPADTLTPTATSTTSP